MYFFFFESNVVIISVEVKPALSPLPPIGPNGLPDVPIIFIMGKEARKNYKNNYITNKCTSNIETII